ncbi:hypothetical protein BDW68DRAFT_16397 [Aspergillus falconensis]
MSLQQQALTGAMKEVIARIRDLVRAEKFKTAQTRGGWKYIGEELENEIKMLKETISSKYKVLTCDFYHVFNSANVHSRTEILLLIPVNGTPTLNSDSNSGEPLLSEKCYYSEVDQLLIGEGCDIIVATLKKDTS